MGGDWEQVTTVTCSNMGEKESSVINRIGRGILRRRAISIVLAAVLVLGGLGAWRIAAAKSQKGGYLTVPVTYGDIATTVSANATVEPTQETVLSFKNSGYVQAVYVAEGQFVKAGTVLAVEQASDYQAQLEQAEATLETAQAGLAKVPDEINQAKASLAQAQANLDLAKTTLYRDEALAAAGAIAKSQLDSDQNAYQNAESAYQSAQANLNMAENTDEATAEAAVKSAQGQVTQAENNLAGCQIVSTMDGYVVNINGSAGQWTVGGAPPTSSSSTTSSQFTITISSSQLELLAEINEADIGKVSVGDKITFTVDPYPNKTFTGQITSLAAEAAAVQGVQYFQSYMSIDDQTGLKAGLPAAVTIVAAQKSHVLVVPRSALDFGATLARGRTGSYVAVLNNGKPQLVPVQTGIVNDSTAEITSGLSPGQLVILSQRQSSGAPSAALSGQQGQKQGPFTTQRAYHMIGG